MDTLINIRAFIDAVDGGSMLAAANRANISPAVISKRIRRLEDELRTSLFIRAGHRIELTAAGRRILPQLREAVGQLDAAISGERDMGGMLHGHIRIKCPTTIAIAHFGPVLLDFQKDHPDVKIDLVMLDRAANPLDEGFDIAIGGMATSYIDVFDMPLTPNPRVLCGSPSYLARSPRLDHPADLMDHRCLNHSTSTTEWQFEGPDGDLAVRIRPYFTANDGRLLIYAATQGHGLTIVSHYVARDGIEAGALVALLPDYPVKDFGLKALVPMKRLHDPIVQKLLSHLKCRFEATPIWHETRPVTW